MRKALEETPKGDRPGLDMVEAALGGFSSPSDGTEETTSERPARTNRRRRR